MFSLNLPFSTYITNIPAKGDLECKGAKKFTAMSCHPAGLFLVDHGGATY